MKTYNLLNIPPYWGLTTCFTSGTFISFTPVKCKVLTALTSGTLMHTCWVSKIFIDWISICLFSHINLPENELISSMVKRYLHDTGQTALPQGNAYKYMWYWWTWSQCPSWHTKSWQIEKSLKEGDLLPCILPKREILHVYETILQHFLVRIHSLVEILKCACSDKFPPFNGLCIFIWCYHVNIFYYCTPFFKKLSVLISSPPKTTIYSLILTWSFT